MCSVCFYFVLPYNCTNSSDGYNNKIILLLIIIIYRQFVVAPFELRKLSKMKNALYYIRTSNQNNHNTLIYNTTQHKDNLIVTLFAHCSTYNKYYYI